MAVVRVSGPEAAAVARALAHSEVPETGVVFRRLYASDGAFLDEALVLAFKAPRSYTGEDTVEFQCHGGGVTPRQVLEACFAAGARLARRGEFTERAFLNGKLDYEQAESVLELIDAKTGRSADAALEKLSGRKAEERRVRADELREERAARARKNDSVLGRVKNTAISTVTREVTRSLTRGLMGIFKK